MKVLILHALLTGILLNIATNQVSGGCLERGLCCRGKNISCWTDGPRISNRSSGFCFCDTACLHLHDCCADFQLQCKPIDCVMASIWSDWGECDTKCGMGIKIRTREILVQPQNGGQKCGPSVERAMCEGFGCKVPRVPEGYMELRETAKIVPANFGPWRTDPKYNPYEDIRQNIFRYFKPKSRLKERPTYCARFEITESRGSCQVRDNPLWSNNLATGASVCVECQSLAMHRELGSRCLGQGVFLRQTHWKAVTIPGCHGKWIMTAPHEENCKCDPDSGVSFIFV